MQWNGVQSNPDRPAPLRSLMEMLQEKAAPYLERYGDNQIPGAGALYNSILRSGTEMVPGVGDLLGVEDLQTAAQNNDWGGIGLGMLAAIPGIPAIGRGGRRARAARSDSPLARLGSMLDSPAPAAMGQTEADAALARYQAANPQDTGARVLSPGDEGYPRNAQWDEASQAYVALTPTHQGAYDISVGGRPAGSVSMAPNGRPFVDRIQIDPAFQRQGVGGQVYDQLEETLGVPLVPSPLGLSNEAQGFWRKRLGALDPMQAQGRINQAMDYGQEFGVDAYDRLNSLRPQAAEPDYPIRAYHGSPHSFDQFELSPRTIGTGEGAQAFGHGLYFAENEGIARGYRDAAVDPDSVPLQFRGKPVDTPWNADIRERWADDFAGLSEDDADAFEELLGNLSQVNNLNDVGNVLGGVSPRARALYNTRVRGDLVKPDFGPGSMYEVGINASPETFLDWDRPLSEQSEAVRRAYAQARASGDPLVSDLLGDLSDPTQLSLAGLFPNSGGAQAYNTLTPEAAEASRRLNEYGISGIRYFDANSRGPGEVYNVGAPTADFGPYSPYTSMDDANAQLEMLRRAGFDNAEIKTQAQPRASNYVVFNDELVKILRKYGISGLGIGTGSAALLGAELERQGQTTEF